MQGLRAEPGEQVGRAAAEADAHLAAGLPAVERGDFTTDHWPATFAVPALDEPDPVKA